VKTININGSVALSTDTADSWNHFGLEFSLNGESLKALKK
jgi:hypothetical protein